MTSWRVWLHDGLVDPADARVSVFDHGLTVGDGVFETLRTYDRRPFALDLHLARLARSAAGLGLPVPPEATIREAVGAVLDAAGAGEIRLRITVTGGMAPLGSGRGEGGPTLFVAAAPLDPVAPAATIATVPWARNERGAVAGLKTTSYAENVVALAHARSLGADEALLANTRGEVCEGTGSNVFVVLDGRLLTPPLSSGCLAGVTREIVLDVTDAEEATIPMGDLARVEEMFLTSSTREVQPVAALDGRTLRGSGDVTAAAQAAFRAAVPAFVS